MMRFSLLFLVLVCVFSLSDASFVNTIYTSNLNGYQVIDGLGGHDVGSCLCEYNRLVLPESLTCEVQTNATSINAIYIAVAPRGVAGEILFQFNGTFGSRHFKQTFEFVDLFDSSYYSNYTAQEQALDFLNGLFYIQIESTKVVSGITYPASSLRGQLEQGSRFFSRLYAKNTIPLSSGTTSSGIATGTYSFNNPTRQLALTVVHDVNAPVSLQFRLGQPNQVGLVHYWFDDYTSPAYDAVQLSLIEQDSFFYEEFYLNLGSVANPLGDIRGQVEILDYLYHGSFTAYLTDGGQGTGCAIASFNCQTRVMEYIIMHNLEGVQNGTIYVNTTNGNSFVTNTPNTTVPLYGAVPLSNGEISGLYENSMQIQLGGLRGNFGTEYEFFAYLSGGNELPAVTTYAKGCALFRVSQSQNGGDVESAISFRITHNIANDTEILEAAICTAPEGVPGESRFTIPFDNSTAPYTFEGNFRVNEDDIEILLTEQFYVQIITEQYLNGQIRGQVRRINPCSATGDSFSVNLSTFGNEIFSYFQSLYVSDFTGDIYELVHAGGGQLSMSVFTAIFMLMIAVLFI